MIPAALRPNRQAISAQEQSPPQSPPHGRRFLQLALQTLGEMEAAVVASGETMAMAVWRSRLESDQDNQIHRFVLTLLNGASLGLPDAVSVARLDGARRECEAFLALRDPLDVVLNQPMIVACDLCVQRVVLEHLLEQGAASTSQALAGDPLEEGSAWIRDVESLIALQENQHPDWRRLWREALAFCRDPQQRPAYFSAEYAARKQEIAQLIRRWRDVWMAAQQQLAEARQRRAGVLPPELQVMEPEVLLGEFLEMWRYCKRRWTSEIEAVELRFLHTFPAARGSLGASAPPPFFFPLERARQARARVLASHSASQLALAAGLHHRGLFGQDSHFQEIMVAAYGHRLVVEVDGSAVEERYRGLSAQEQSILMSAIEHWNPQRMFWEPLESPESMHQLLSAVRQDFNALPIIEQQKIFGAYLELYRDAVTEHPELGFRHPRLDELESIRRRLERVPAVPEEIEEFGVQEAIRSLIAAGLGARFPGSVDRISAVLDRAIALCASEELPDHEVVESSLGFFQSHLQRIRMLLRQGIDGVLTTEEQRLDFVLNRLEALRRAARQHGVIEPDALARCLASLTDGNAVQEHHALLLAGVQATLRDWPRLRARVQTALLQDMLIEPVEEAGQEGPNEPATSAFRLSETGARMWLVLTGVLQFANEEEQHPLLAWTQDRVVDCIGAIAPHLSTGLRLRLDCARVRLENLGRRLRNGLSPLAQFQENGELGRDGALALELIPREAALYHQFDSRIRGQRAVCLAAVIADPRLMVAIPERWSRDSQFVADAIDGCGRRSSAIEQLLARCATDDLLSEEFVLAVLAAIAVKEGNGSIYTPLDVFCDALPSSIRDNERVAEAVVRLRPVNLLRMATRMQVQLCEPVLDAGWCLVNFPDAVRDNPQAVRRSARVRADAMTFASARLARDENLMLELAHFNGELVLAVGDLWRDHGEILLAASKSCPQVVALASPGLLHDRQWLRRVIETNARCLLYLPLYSFLPLAGEDLEEHGLAAAAISRDGLLIREVPDSRRTPRLIQMALEQNGLALAYLDESGRSNEEFVRLAMQQNPLALVYAAPELRERRDLCDLLLQRAGGQDEAWWIAVNEDSRRDPEARDRWDRACQRETDWSGWDELAQMSQDDPEGIETWESILSKDGLALARAPTWVRDHPDCVIAAFQQDRRALLAIGPELLEDGDFFHEVWEILGEDPPDPFDPLFVAWLAWTGGGEEASQWIRIFPRAYELLPRSVREVPAVLDAAVQSAHNFALLPEAYRNTPQAITSSWEDRVEHQLRFASLFCYEHRECLLQDIARPELTPLQALPYGLRRDREAIRWLARWMRQRLESQNLLEKGLELLRTLDEELRADAGFMLEIADLYAPWIAAAADALFEDEGFVTEAICREVEAGEILVDAHVSRLLCSGGFWQHFMRNPGAIQRLGDRIEAAFQHAPIEIRRDPAWVRTLVRERPMILAWASACLRGDRQFCLDLVAEQAECWQGILPALITEEFAFQALCRNGKILPYLSPQWRHKDELVAAAYSNDPDSIRWAGQDLQSGERFEGVQRRAAALRGSPVGRPGQPAE